MTISFAGANEASPSIDAPAGTRATDLLLLSVTSGVSTAPSLTGWTNIPGGGSGVGFTYWRIASGDGSDTVDLTVFEAGLRGDSGSMAAYRGVGSPIAALGNPAVTTTPDGGGSETLAWGPLTLPQAAYVIGVVSVDDGLTTPASAGSGFVLDHLYAPSFQLTVAWVHSSAPVAAGSVTPQVTGVIAGGGARESYGVMIVGVQGLGGGQSMMM